LDRLFLAIRKLFDINSAALEESERYRDEFIAEKKQAEQNKAA
jgi:hypothetical protein